MKNLMDCFPIRGFCLREVLTEPIDDHWIMTFRLQDKNGPLGLVLRLPRPGDDGVYDINGVDKVLILEGRRGIEYPKEPNWVNSVWVLDHNETLVDLIERALDKALVSATQGNPPAEQAGQEVIDDFFSSSPLVRQVDPHKGLDMEMIRNTVHINVSGSSLDPEDRRIRDWCGAVDPLTTPQGSRAMQTFQMAGGSKVEDGRIAKGHRIMSPVMDRCILLPENTRPIRLLLTRTAFAKHEELVKWENPWARSTNYVDGDLRGTHLFTAVMAHKYNYQDCIVIGHSAAEKMACYRRLSQSIVDLHTIEVLVNPGTGVQPDDPVFRIDEGLDHDGKPKFRVIRTRRLTTPAKVVDVRRIHTHILGEPAERVRVSYEMIYTLMDGDKITNRHGGKGVVRVVPDREMPEIKTRDGWRRAEVLVHPLSTVGRRPLGMFREMMINRLAIKRGKPIDLEHFSSEMNMKRLCSMKLGSSRKARLKGWPLQFPVYAAPLYWLRLDKHAREEMSALGSTKPLNFAGLNPDAGRISGQRINLGMATVMHAKGLRETHRVLHRENVEKGAIRMIEDLMSVLAHTGQQRRRQ